jgi:AraC-like DNA-binding protein
MTIHHSSVRFRSREDFFDSINQPGKSGGRCASGDKRPFAFAEMEEHWIFRRVKLRFFELLPSVDIYVPYECARDYFEIAYCAGGHLFMLDKYVGESKFQANNVSVTSGQSTKGSLIFPGGQLFKGVIFETTDGIMTSIMGEDADKRPSMCCRSVSPPGVFNPFFQITNCRYPSVPKRIFFESKFLDILSRLIAREMRGSDEDRGIRKFEAEQIKKIPEILMERIDSLPTIPELAHELSLNATTMKRGFKKIFGEPIFAHHRNTCLEQASLALLETDRTILEIALDAGYSNGENFCSAFKKRYGVSPVRYRGTGPIF